MFRLNNIIKLVIMGHDKYLQLILQQENIFLMESGNFFIYWFYENIKFINPEWESVRN